MEFNLCNWTKKNGILTRLNLVAKNKDVDSQKIQNNLKILKVITLSLKYLFSSTKRNVGLCLIV